MLQLKDIKKEYYVADDVVHALKGVSLTFRESEFVSILGPSGCGKTTLLNIIGGLDRYTSGDLVINGKSTKQFKDKDWDGYRNHRIGFVFQSYNLIPHLTVLENVELALTLSGVSKGERKKKAQAVLERVGLGDKINVKPNQLSGGQMQRVAIARALVNDPDILLADEPTGALDTTTSVQILDLLKEVAQEKLVIMVTHNPDLADEYSTRIVRLLDGEIIADSNPYNPQTEEVKKVSTKKEKTNMSFFTALSLSFKNLLTKKARTLLVSFAGSIGIIGIALILSLSNGFQLYINRVQEDALSNYPVTIYNETQNLAAMMETMTQGGMEYESFPEEEVVFPTPILNNMLATSTVGTVTNDLKSFNEYLLGIEGLDQHINGIQYAYDVDINLFKWYEEFDEDVDVSSYRPVNSLDMMSYVPGGNSMAGLSSFFDVFTEMLDNQELLQVQYDLLAGEWNDITSPNQALLVVSEYNTIPDYVLYNLGLRTNNITYQYYKFLLLNGYFESVFGNIPMFILDPDNQFGFLVSDNPMYPDFSQSHINSLTDQQKEKIMNDLLDMYYDETENAEIPMEDLVGLTYQVLPTALMYQNNSGVYTLQETDSQFVQDQIENNSIPLEIVGIVRVKEGNASGSLGSGVSYSPALTREIISKTDNSPVVLAQKADETIDVTTGLPFESSSASENYDAFSVVNVEHPESISIFPKTFEDKDYIVDLIKQYNNDKEEIDQISYTDTLGIMISSMTVILSAITIVLTAFVSTSLVVSSIMIGVITYISVLERIKEIGVLRSVGASKRDIANVFNAEAIIIGFVAGVLGLGITLLITIPVNIIVKNLTGIVGVATLPWVGGIILGAISVLLTFIAGLIPSKMAANKDPVEALRTE